MLSLNSGTFSEVSLASKNITLVREKYDERLRKKGYKSRNQNINQAKLIFDFSEYFSIQYITLIIT